MIITIFGEDTYRSLQYLKALESKFTKTHSGLLVEHVDAVPTDATPVRAAIGSGSLFGDKKLLIIRGAFGLLPVDQKKIVTQLEGASKEKIIVFYESGKTKFTASLGKFLATKDKKEFTLLAGPALIKEAQRLLAAQKIVIEPAALHALLTRTGTDLWFFDNEIQKLHAFMQGKAITLQAVESLTAHASDPQIFATIDAIARRNRTQALALIHQHLKNGEDEHYLASMVTYQFRNIITVKYLQQQGRTADEIRKVTRLHPFVISKAQALAQNFAMTDLKKIYNKLASLDVALKSGEIDPTLALDVLVAGLTR